MKVERIELWSGSIDDAPGGAACSLAPLAEAGVDLRFVLARRTPENPGKGILFVAPVRGEKAEAAARSAGLAPATDVAAIRVEGPNAAGVGYRITRAIADAGKSFRGLAASVVGGNFVCYVAFDTAWDANRAADVVGAIAPPASMQLAARRAKMSKRKAGEKAKRKAGEKAKRKAGEKAKRKAGEKAKRAKAKRRR
jgi:hypothetical protein